MPRTPHARSVDDLADVMQLRAAVAAALRERPIDEATLRAAVWTFGGKERRAEVPAAEIIRRLTSIVDELRGKPYAAHRALRERVVLWCVEEYFGHLGGDPLQQFARHADDPVVPS